MGNLSKTSLKRGFFLKSLFILITISLFFPIRHVFFSKEAYLSGDYSDFTSFSLYISDILLFISLIFVILPRGREFLHVTKPLKWLIFWVLLAFVANFGLNTRLNVFLLLRWSELIVAYGTFVLLFKEFELKSLFLSLFVGFCSIESIIGLLQFARQSPIGLFKVGEQHIGPSILGVAKIVSSGTTFIRAYGTFPHPNPLSAFIVGGILMVIYLLLNTQSFKTRLIYSVLLFLNILGLTVTFSRGAYLALGVGLILFFGFLFWKRINRSFAPFGLTLVVLAIAIVSSFVLFKPLLLTRATFSDQSTIERKFYDVTGVKMAIKNPVFGVGLGESMLMMEKYSGQTLAPWDKQPPLNYFIIAAAEMGIPAALILLWIFLGKLWGTIKKIKLENNPKLTSYYLLLTTILCSFLVLMQFDHYFYTLEQTQLLLWVILALMASEIKNPQAGD